MAENISDDQFKSEVLRFIEVASQKFDGLTSDVRSNAFKLDRLESGVSRVDENVNSLAVRVSHLDEKLDGVSSDLKLLTIQFNDVGAVAIKDSRRIDDIEDRVDLLETGSH